MIISAIYIRPTKRIIYSFDHSDLIDSSSDWAPFSNLFMELSRMMTDDSAWPAAVSHIIGPHSDTLSNACHHGEEILFKIQSHKKKTFERNMARCWRWGWISAFSAAWWAKNPHPKISNTRNHKQGRTITLKEVGKLDWCVTYFSASFTKDFNLFRLLVAAFRIPGKATGCCNVSVDTLKSVPLCQSTTVKRTKKKKKNAFSILVLVHPERMV